MACGFGGRSALGYDGYRDRRGVIMLQKHGLYWLQWWELDNNGLRSIIWREYPEHWLLSKVWS